ncbi:MAG: gamma carbonic anhydrase family protein [Bacillota bacterium]|nr:gamma carbonic anhydrase family protein [Bacillota bacterium]
MPVLRYKNHKPLLGAEVYIALNACVIGRVSIGPRSNVWFGAVIRGDLADITIGEECSLQDNITIHVDENEPVVVGNRVTVGHNAVLHGCKIEDDVLIGMGAIILNGAVIGRDSLVGAGSLITPETIIPPRSLVLGSPGKVVRRLTDEQIPAVDGMYRHYLKLMQEYRESDDG